MARSRRNIRLQLRLGGTIAGCCMATAMPGVAAAQAGVAQTAPTRSDQRQPGADEPLTAGAASPAGAPDVPASQAGQQAGADQTGSEGDVIVTGSRIVRDGARAPPPPTLQ